MEVIQVVEASALFKRTGRVYFSADSKTCFLATHEFRAKMVPMEARLADGKKPSESAYSYQVAGSHYSGMALQPFAFAMRNHWDAGAFSILKYLSRHRLKKGLEDLNKADHFVQLRLEERDSWPSVLMFTRSVTMADYIYINAIKEADEFALLSLESWVLGQCSEKPLLKAIGLLKEEYTGDQIPIAFGE